MEVGLIVLLAVVGALPHPKAGSAGAGYWSQKIRLPTWEPTTCQSKKSISFQKKKKKIKKRKKSEADTKHARTLATQVDSCNAVQLFRLLQP